MKKLFSRFNLKFTYEEFPIENIHMVNHGQIIPIDGIFFFFFVHFQNGGTGVTHLVNRSQFLIVSFMTTVMILFPREKRKYTFDCKTVSTLL